MKISNLHIKNIGIFDDVMFDFPTTDGTDIHILTGSNGSGKTTVLLILAGLFMGSTGHRSNPDSANYLKKRVRFFEQEQSGDYKSFATFGFDTNKSEHIMLRGCDSCKNFHTNKTPGFEKLEEYRTLLLQNYLPTDTKVDFAAFAYSGYRYIESQYINPLNREKIINPLRHSLDFIKNYENNSASILQWIANNEAKYFIAKGKGDPKADQYKSSVLTVERIISEITGKEISFEISLDPVEVYLKIGEKTHDFDVLPDGLRSLISWIADLLMRLDMLPWENNKPILERNIILLLDEIESHLHPKWQRKVLPVVQKLFKNAQIFVSTHSPFVVNSVDGAYIHKLKIVNGAAVNFPPEISNTAISIESILDVIFDVDEDFGWETQNRLEEFYALRNDILANKDIDFKAFLALASSLAVKNVEVRDIIQFELKQINKIKKTDYVI